MDYRILDTHIDHILEGDTVIHNGKMVTVNSSDIKRNPFEGSCIFGDSYRLGYRPVKKVVFECKKGLIF